MPASLDLVKRLRADGVPATVSGAGPTVLALATPDSADRVAKLGGDGWRATACPSTLPEPPCYRDLAPRRAEISGACRVESPP